jgi:hypothetical protein
MRVGKLQQIANFGRRVHFYGRQMLQHRTRAGSLTQLRNWMGLFPDWQRSMDVAPVAERGPWITYGAISHLASYIRSDMRICEYGVGGSTLFYLDRVAQVVSIEHDAEWADRLKSILPDAASGRWTVHITPPQPCSFAKAPDPTDPDAYVSTLANYANMSFKAYAETIELYPDRSFDAVQVDGRVRHCCVKHAVSKVKPNGLLILDDSHRERYADSHKRLEALGWEKHEYFGPGPYEWGFRTTCIWRRPLP